MDNMKFYSKSVYFVVLLLIIGFSLIMGLSKKRHDYSISNKEVYFLNSEKISVIKIVGNGKTTEVVDSGQINSFIKILKTCTLPIQPRKMRVQDSYEVFFIEGENKYKIQFSKRTQMPLMMINSNHHQFDYYNCKAMESFLNKYK